MLKRRLFLTLTALLVLYTPVLAQDHSAHAGKETRDIKALSADDVAALLAGDGAGLALAAELNGYPGPRHVLDLRAELALTAVQHDAVAAIFAAMNARARALGQQLVDHERGYGAHH